MSEDRKKTLESQFWGTDNINEELNEIKKLLIFVINIGIILPFKVIDNG